MTDPDPLMSREEVAEFLVGLGHASVKPDSVRKILARYGIREQRGYPRAEVEALQRPGRGRRTDLQRKEEQP